MRYLLYSMMVIFIVGCANDKQNLGVPSWYLNSPQNSSTSLYGEGEGYDKKESINNALSSMSSKLIVSVKSIIDTTTTANSDQYYLKETTKNVVVEAKKIEFTNAKVYKIQQVNGSIYTIMEVNRIELFDTKYNKFQTKHKSIQDRYNDIKRNSKMQQIKELTALKPKLISAQSKAILLNAINKSFDYEKYTSLYQSYINKIDKLKAKLVIKVASNHNREFFKDSMISALNTENYRVSSQNYDINIVLTNKIRYSKAMGWDIAKVATTISSRTSTKVLSTKIINTIGRSSSNKDNALNDASRAFEEKIKNIGINNLLFEK
ncbi:MAG: hypothetical protein DRG11_02165 [Epsilonproteobacteria bacterium]|nr:MAG: hypothetical protein DRG11_02165 [Campylobacterota bacterium]